MTFVISDIIHQDKTFTGYCHINDLTEISNEERFDLHVFVLSFLRNAFPSDIVDLVKQNSHSFGFNQFIPEWKVCHCTVLALRKIEA